MGLEFNPILQTHPLPNQTFSERLESLGNFHSHFSSGGLCPVPRPPGSVATRHCQGWNGRITHLSSTKSRQFGHSKNGAGWSQVAKKCTWKKRLKRVVGVSFLVNHRNTTTQVIWSDISLNGCQPKNNGTPKSSILIGFSIIFTIHFGVPLFLETPKCDLTNFPVSCYSKPCASW